MQDRGAIDQHPTDPDALVGARPHEEAGSVGVERRPPARGSLDVLVDFRDEVAPEERHGPRGPATSCRRRARRSAKGSTSVSAQAVIRR